MRRDLPAAFRRLPVLLPLLAALLAAPAPAARAAAADGAFDALGREFLDHWIGSRPHVATRLGVHDHDAKLTPVTEAVLERERAWYQEFDARLAAFARAHPPGQLSFERRLEYEVLAARVARERLDFEVIRPFERNPNAYLPLVAGSIQSLLDRRFSSSCLRLRAASRRLRQVPEILRAAKVNLKDPPRVHTETAIAQFAGVLRLYRVVVPAVALTCKDPATQGMLAEADSIAVRAVENFLVFLREDLLPRSGGAYALGAETYARKLRADDMEETPAESLLARGRREIAATRERMDVLAERIAPGGGVTAALDSLQAVHPADSALVPEIAGQLDSIRAFLRSRPIVTLPARENLRVRETPEWARSLGFASLDAPGVWERRATEAFYNVTPVDPGWTEAQKRDHLAFFNRRSSEIVTIHEALPGHYYQLLAMRGNRSRLRQALTSGSFIEGWAHYCEQMMVEEGFGGGDPRTHFAQQYLALQRLGRLVAGIALHTQGWTQEEAERFFQDQCLLAPVNAAREARRGTQDPTYLVYTLGKWRILDLRDEVRRRLGARFDLKAFHDALLRQGGSPLPVARLGVLRELGIAEADAATGR